MWTQFPPFSVITVEVLSCWMFSVCEIAFMERQIDGPSISYSVFYSLKHYARLSFGIFFSLFRVVWHEV